MFRIWVPCKIDSKMSVNSMYLQMRRRRVLNPAARELKQLIASEAKKESGPMCGEEIEIHIVAHKDWMCKNGNPKVQDISNLIKLIEDAVCDGIGTDDRWVWKITARKRQSTKKEGLEIKWDVF